MSSGGADQRDLFGNPAPDPPTRPPSRIESNDVELMMTVAANAVRCGYLLVGASERVYARTDGDGRVARVPRFEEDAVHQLLRRRWLTLGSAHRVTCGSAQLTGTAVLIPKATRDQIAHWTWLQRPPSWPSHHRKPAGGAPVCELCQGVGRVPDSRQTAWTPERGVHRPLTSSPCHWCQKPT